MNVFAQQSRTEILTMHNFFLIIKKKLWILKKKTEFFVVVDDNGNNLSIQNVAKSLVSVFDQNRIS